MRRLPSAATTFQTRSEDRSSIHTAENGDREPIEIRTFEYLRFEREIQSFLRFLRALRGRVAIFGTCHCSMGGMRRGESPLSATLRIRTAAICRLKRKTCLRPQRLPKAALSLTTAEAWN